MPQPEAALETALKKVRGELSRTPAGLVGALSAVADAEVALRSLQEVRVRKVAAPLAQWGCAFRRQAVEDLQSAKILVDYKPESAVPWTVVAMLLQMVFEKTAKAVLAHTDRSQFLAALTSHGTAKYLIRTIKAGPRCKAIREKYGSMLPDVAALCDLHPSLRKSGPHLEYPWEDGSTLRVVSPGELPEFQPAEIERSRRRYLTMINVAQTLLGDFDQLFLKSA